MRLKAILKFYFKPEEAETRLNRLICHRAYSLNSSRGAYDCAVAVAELLHKKGELCVLWGFLNGAAEKFSDGELEKLKEYAFAPRRRGSEGREMHRLAVAFARRIRGGTERFAESFRVMEELGL